jgi:hypothetical protein
VKFHEAAREGQADSKASVSLLQGTVDLCEHVEDLWQHLLSQSDAIVLDDEPHGVANAVNGERNVPANRCEFARIIEQIAENLSQSGRVGFDDDRIVGHVDLQLVSF